MSDSIFRRCPYCGANLDVNKCDIVEVEFDKDSVTNNNAQGSSVYRIRTIKKQGILKKYIPNEKRLERYQCYACNQPLPAGFAMMETKVIAVVGLNRAGKTHFIGSSLPLAYQRTNLNDFFNGFITDFDAIEETDWLLTNEYLRKMDFDGELPATNPLNKYPLFFRVRFKNGYQFLLVLYDLGGEAFMDTSNRSRDAAFLEWADAVIFTVDPTAMREAGKLPGIDADRWERSGGSLYREVSQVNLLSKINDIVFRNNYGYCKKHLAVVLTKGDLIYEVPGISNIQTMNSDSDCCNDQDLALSRISTVDFLLKAGEGRIVDIAKQAPSFSFHTISTGRNTERKWVNGFTPIRVLDPWVVTLSVLGGLQVHYLENYASPTTLYQPPINSGVPLTNNTQGFGGQSCKAPDSSF